MALVLLTGCLAANAASGMSPLREAAYNPNVLEREGLALLRIVGSPAAIVTEGSQFYEEYSASCGRSMPLSFLTGCVKGCFVMGFEIAGGTIELVSFQQIKSWAYPWEFDPPDQAAIARMKSNAESNEPSPAAEAVGTAVGEAVGEAVRNSMEKKSKKNGPRKVQAPAQRRDASGGAAKPKVKHRVRHSSCRGTGICPICHGRRKVGNGIRCSGCGGSGRCRACRGSGYAN